MSQLAYLVPLLLVLSTILGASHSSAPMMLASTFTAPQLRVDLPTPRVAAGTEQTLQIQLDQSADRVATLVLVVTYPNGVIERSLHSIRGSKGDLTWLVPMDVGMGAATFSISADGCGCEQQSTVPPPTRIDSIVEGGFYIMARHAA
ncbi:MAG: hypothetical protein KF832_00905 [Caldilineaceae bacterium]|nr:hypothetical protein [Caldilineaceae bacterium]